MEASETWKIGSMRLDGKVAIVAGVGGLGKAIALGMADAGADLVVADLNLGDADEVTARAAAAGKKAKAIRFDASQPEESQKVVDFALAEYGRLDILFNGVGINIRGPSLEVTPEQWDRLHDVNLKGAFFFAQAAAKAFVKQGTGGKIVTISSHLGIVGMEHRASYSASKAGVINLTRSLAHEWAKYRINVNTIAPCFTRTAINATTFDDPEFYATITKRIPFGRSGTAEDLVGAAIFLSSDAADFVTGHTLVVDGGWLTW